MSHFVDFPNLELCAEFNRREGIPDDAPDRWSGANTAGGSPREGGSMFGPGLAADFVAVTIHLALTYCNGRQLIS